MSRRKKTRGFVVGEVLVLVSLLAFTPSGITLVDTTHVGNFLVSEESVLKAIQEVDPTVMKLVSLKRRAWGFSMAIVKYEDGFERILLIDVSILQNVTVKRITDK